MPVYDDYIREWREQSSLGNYLDYGPLRESLPGEQNKFVHAVCYRPTRSGYFATVQEAKAWIDQLVAEAV